MERNVTFLLHGKRTGGLLVKRNKRTVHVMAEPYEDPISRRIKRHKVQFAIPGQEFGKDPNVLPKWYFQYYNFLERRSG